MKKLHYIVLLPCLFLNSINSSLGSSTAASMNVTATVQTTCTLTVPGSIAFGNYTLTAISVNAGNIVVTCTQGTGYTLSIDKGTNGTSVTDRKMALTGSSTSTSTGSLKYALKDSSGASGNNIASYNGNGTGSAYSYPVYGYIGPNEPAPVGSYTDTVNVTLTY